MRPFGAAPPFGASMRLAGAAYAVSPSLIAINRERIKEEEKRNVPFRVN